MPSREQQFVQHLTMLGDAAILMGVLHARAKHEKHDLAWQRVRNAQAEVMDLSEQFLKLYRTCRVPPQHLQRLLQLAHLIGMKMERMNYATSNREVVQLKRQITGGMEDFNDAVNGIVTEAAWCFMGPSLVRGGSRRRGLRLVKNRRRR